MCRAIAGWFEKKSSASEIGMSRTSAMLRPLNVISRVSRL